MPTHASASRSSSGTVASGPPRLVARSPVPASAAAPAHGHSVAQVSITARSPVIQCNPYHGAIVDREEGQGPAVQGPLSLTAHRLLISRNLNIRSSNLNTFEQAAHHLARERESDEALQQETQSHLYSPSRR